MSDETSQDSTSSTSVGISSNLQIGDVRGSVPKMENPPPPPPNID